MLSHSITFQGSPADASAAMEHDLTRLAELGCKITDRRSWAVDPTGEQALSRTSLVLPGGEQAVLSVAPPPNKHDAESNSYIALSPCPRATRRNRR